MVNIYRVLPFYMRVQNAQWAWIARHSCPGEGLTLSPALSRLLQAALADNAEAERRGLA